eukprot:5178439-Amphidinium_carterae.1
MRMWLTRLNFIGGLHQHWHYNWSKRQAKLELAVKKKILRNRRSHRKGNKRCYPGATAPRHLQPCNDGGGRGVEKYDSPKKETPFHNFLCKLCPRLQHTGKKMETS